ncbi:internal scaffolding protein [Blackfly microvirus SF02]|uniref:Internal scaffolding protein n=1 Tax=Blackfly microvirus SF02 TaxID=2576452 RepID=A0A4P8PKA7_9VIRU|nr:internal scaffolding protein [Blackfly microvirus SF02]
MKTPPGQPNKARSARALTIYRQATTNPLLGELMSKKNYDQYTGELYPVAVHDFWKPRESDPGMTDWGPSLTRQEFLDECDINTIMAHYEANGVISHVNRAAPQYIDLTTMPPDYQTALGLLAEAETAFMTLPATVRREFNNDPQEFVAFASDPENLPQMRTWGLAPPAPVVESTAPAASAEPNGDPSGPS